LIFLRIESGAGGGGGGGGGGDMLKSVYDTNGDGEVDIATFAQNSYESVEMTTVNLDAPAGKVWALSEDGDQGFVDASTLGGGGGGGGSGSLILAFGARVDTGEGTLITVFGERT